MSLLIIGGTTIDVIFAGISRLPSWPDHTEFTLDNLVIAKSAPLITLGGNGANAAFVASRCGAEVVLQTNIGNDAFGGVARNWLESTGCRIRSAAFELRTPVNVTAASRTLRRATLFFPGSIPPLRGSGKGFRYALACGWPHHPPSTLARALKAWRRHGVRTVWDPGPFLGRAPTLDSLKPVLSALSILLGNAHELLALTRARSLELGLARLRARFLGDVVVKCGRRGALWLPAGESAPQQFRARAVKTLNTIGAGDTFNGALLAALDGGGEFPDALRYACNAAASVVCSPQGVLGLQVKPVKTPRK
jgi:ribokinase